MIISTNIQSVFERIYRSEDEWKALYLAVWNYSREIDRTYINKAASENKKLYLTGLTSGTSCVVSASLDTPLADEIIGFSLPASKMGFYEYNPKKLYSILVSRDGHFTLGHLQTMFSLFEELLSTIARDVYSKDINTGKFEGIRKFFEIEDFKNVLTPTSISELKLAKETRNCFIHNSSKIDKRWVDAYEEARKVRLDNLVGNSLGAGLSNQFHEVEDWQKLTLGISKEIEAILSKR